MEKVTKITKGKTKDPYQKMLVIVQDMYGVWFIDTILVRYKKKNGIYGGELSGKPVIDPEKSLGAPYGDPMYKDMYGPCAIFGSLEQALQEVYVDKRFAISSDIEGLEVFDVMRLPASIQEYIRNPRGIYFPVSLESSRAMEENRQIIQDWIDWFPGPRYPKKFPWE